MANDKLKITYAYDPEKKYVITLKLEFTGIHLEKVLEKIKGREPIKLTNLQYYWVEEKYETK